MTTPKNAPKTAPKSSKPTGPLQAHPTLNEALWSLQVALPAISKDGENPHYRSKYITYDHIKSVVTPHLHAAGLLLDQWVQGDGTNIEVGTRLIHVDSGEASRSNTLRAAMPAAAQDVGKLVTYFRRYTLVALLGIRAGDDDDGEADRRATEKAAAEQEKTKARMINAFGQLGITRQQIEAHAGPVQDMTKADIEELGKAFIEINEHGSTWEEWTSGEGGVA